MIEIVSCLNFKLEKEEAANSLRRSTPKNQHMNPTLRLHCLLMASLALVAPIHAADDVTPERETKGSANSEYGKTKPSQGKVIEKLEAGMIETPVKMPWRLFVPEGATKEKPLPLILFLHGSGKMGTENIGPMSLAWEFITPEAQAKNPCFVLAPQLPKGTFWMHYDEKTRGSYNADQVKITAEMQATLSLVEKLAGERPIDRKRLYVIGQSRGGFGTWDAMIRRPDLWAAGVPICGAGDPNKAELIKSIPIWAWHGANDAAVPVAGSREMIEALKKAGANPLYTEPHNVGHGVWVPALEDPKLHEWLFNQRKP